MDYGRLYDLESYLEGTVRPRFQEQGYLTAFDFLCIVIWKANRAKSRVARRLLARGHAGLEAAVAALTRELAGQPTAKERLRCLFQEWGINLPMASAILAVLYPDEFTVYDIRVCNALGGFHYLAQISSFERLWPEYQAFVQAVREAAPAELSLRDKDRYLWGKSFHDQLRSDIERRFGVEPARGPDRRG